MYGTMVWATDGSDAAGAALEEALRLAAAPRSRPNQVVAGSEGAAT